MSGAMSGADPGGPMALLRVTLAVLPEEPVVTFTSSARFPRKR